MLPPRGPLVLAPSIHSLRPLPPSLRERTGLDTTEHAPWPPILSDRRPLSSKQREVRGRLGL